MQGPTFLVLEVHPSHYSKQIIKAILQLSPTNLFLSTVTHYTVRIVTFAVYYISHTIFQIKHIRCVSKLPLWLFWASLSVHDCVWWSMPVAGMKLVHIPTRYNQIPYILSIGLQYECLSWLKRWWHTEWDWVSTMVLSCLQPAFILEYNRTLIAQLMSSFQSRLPSSCRLARSRTSLHS